jgi:3-oxoacyl-[acyl-carrier-protein] synthase-3
MAGPAVIVNAVRRMSAAVRALLERNELSVPDVRWIVPHQANGNLLDQLAKALGVDRADERVVSVIAEFGNTSSASMGIALDRLRRSGKIASGDRIVLPAFGAGFTWGAGLLQSSYGPA